MQIDKEVKDGDLFENRENEKCNKMYFLGWYNESIPDGYSVFDANDYDIFYGSSIFRIK